MRFFADYHTHTCYSHGIGTVRDNARAAQIRGLSEIAIADHGPANLFGVGVDDLDTFEQIRKEIAQVNQELHGTRLLYAVEANIIDINGRIDIPLPMQKSFDIVLMGLHILVKPHSFSNAAHIAFRNILARMWEKGERAAMVANTDLMVAAVYRNKVDIVTHPGYRLLIDTRELAKACVANGTAMEINTGHQYTTPRYIQRAAQTGVRFAIGSDAHEPARVGDLNSGWELAKAAGVDPCQILNVALKGRDTEAGSEISARRWRFDT